MEDDEFEISPQVLQTWEQSELICDTPATVRTLVGQGFLLPVICSLFTLRTSLFNRISQVEHFCTKVDRVIHLVLDGWTFPDHSKNVWEARWVFNPTGSKQLKTYY